MFIAVNVIIRFVNETFHKYTIMNLVTLTPDKISFLKIFLLLKDVTP